MQQRRRSLERALVGPLTGGGVTSGRVSIWLTGAVVSCALVGIAPAARGDAALVKVAPPAILGTVESRAEDIVDYALAGDRGSVVAEAARLKSDANGEAARVLLRSGVRPPEVALLGRRSGRVATLARSGSFVAVALSANAVSQLMPALYTYFRDPVPPDVLKLDWLDREAQLRSLAHEPSGVSAVVAELARTWPLVRRKVVLAGGASEAAAYDRHVAALQRLDPAAGKRVQAEASWGLGLVDDLERVFSRQRRS